MSRISKTLSRVGSVKDVYLIEDVEEGYLERLQFKFTDRVSIFDIGPLPQLFPDLGKYRCAIAGYLFQQMKEAGFSTHYISHDVEKATMDIKPYNIPELGVDYGDDAYGRILGVELVDHRMLTNELLCRALREESETSLQFKINRSSSLVVLVGSKLKPALVVCTTKQQTSDCYVSDDKACELAGIDETTLQAVYTEVRKASDFLVTLFNKAGFERHSGKFQIAISFKNDGTLKEITFVDTISPDEMQLVGIVDELVYDKDLIRKYYQDSHSAWYNVVSLFKKSFAIEKAVWSLYPAESIPAGIINEVVNRYRTVAEAIGAIEPAGVAV